MMKWHSAMKCKLFSRGAALAALGLVAAVALTSFAYAEDDAAWPQAPVHVIVPFPAGGGTDIVGRIVVEKLNDKFGRHFIVENKDGASTIVGTEAAARAQPDGYTLLYTTTPYTINPSVQRHMPFDTKASFVPIGLTAFHPFVLLAHPSLGVSSVAELIALAKKDPGQINYASVGTGSSQHLEMELLKQLAGIELTHVPYRGSSPAMTDLIGGHVSLMWNGLSPSLGAIQQGSLRALAVDAKSRVGVLPNVPTIEEAGLPGFNILTWSGLFAPAGTPRAITDRLMRAIKEINADPDFAKRLADLGLQPGGPIGVDFGTFLDNDMTSWAKLVAATGAKIE
jgi:tripartite-type tricarboxylate transporter receptor subunit TctC